MTLGGSLFAEFDIKSSADEFCQGYKAIANPPEDKVSLEELDFDLPPKKRKTQLKMEGFQISEWFKTLPKPNLEDSTSDEAKSQNPDYYTKLEGTMTVIYRKGIDGGHAIWTIQFEKISDDIKDSRFIIDLTTEYFKAMDKRIFSNKPSDLSKIVE